MLAVLVLLVGLGGLGVAWFAREGLTEDRGTSTLPGPVRGVDIQIDSGHVDVVAGPGVDAKVQRTRRYLRGAPKLTETFVDGMVAVTSACQDTVKLGCSVDIRVEVPAATPVRVRSTRGTVSVDGMTNGVDVATSAGAVRLARTSGVMKATTSAGSVTGVELAPTALDAVTSAGAIRITLAEPAGRVDLRTGAGDIDLALPVAPGGYRVTTNRTGSKSKVTVVQDPSSGRAVSARTGGGRITIHPR
jgi:DUF4097 and DUF4098 domain-containing protein YvlB